VLLMCVTVPEPARRVRARPVQPGDLWRALRDTPPLQYFLVTQVLFGLATGAVASLFVIYTSQIPRPADKVPQIALPMTLAMALGMPLWLQVMKHVDKHRAWAVAAAGMIVTLLVVPWVVPGPGRARADDRDHDELRLLPRPVVDCAAVAAGRHRRLRHLAQPAGPRGHLLFSFQALVTKLNQGVGGAIALSIPALFGFVAEGAPTPGAASA
jgi:glycoside/pentoside/hexuronide:cation symporter, GPH family